MVNDHTQMFGPKQQVRKENGTFSTFGVVKRQKKAAPNRIGAAFLATRRRRVFRAP
jgi:hypothetical protein